MGNSVQQTSMNTSHSSKLSEPQIFGQMTHPSNPYMALQVCGKEPYIVERIVAEKSWWCKNCFRCVQCNKLLNLDTYVSHEGAIYCKQHHKELFQPKVVKEDLVDLKGGKGRNKAGM